MTDSDRIRWNDRFRGESLYLGEEPSVSLAARLETLLSLCPGRRALDVACGEGRNAIFLARGGFDVTAVDISERGLEKGRARAAREGVQVSFLQRDLESCGLSGQWDLIVNTNFLLRPLFPQMREVLSPGGIVLFESVLGTGNLEGHHNPAYLLAPGELRSLFSALEGELLEYAELDVAPFPSAFALFRKRSGRPAGAAET